MECKEKNSSFLLSNHQTYLYYHCSVSSKMESKLDFFAKLLTHPNGKDKMIRLCSYSAMLLGSSKLISRTNSSSLMVIASQLSYARTILRLFDDIPMLKYNLDCMKSSRSRSSTIISEDFTENLLIRIINLVDQLYYPAEHMVSTSLR